MFLIASSLLFCAVTFGKPVELTNDNFKDTVAGKNAFVKFFAPWCGHCKAMKPAWDELGEEYAGSSSVVIGDVDCTAEQDLCSTHGVSGYPTIKYWNDETGDDGEKYSGGRDLEALKKFTEESLAAKCDAKTKENCDEKEVKFIDAMAAKSADDRAKQLTRLSGMSGGKMKPELKAWIKKRIAILKQLDGGDAKEEL